MANKKQKFGDIVENHNLVKRTLMVSAFPALITEVEKDGEKFYKGFLPGFEFSEVDDFEDEEELVETLQDMLDDEVEELVVFGKSLPNLPEDEELLKKNKGYKIAYLDINVYADKDDEDFYDCSHDCSCCGGHCHDDSCDCEDDCDCDDDSCNCDNEEKKYEHCDCEKHKKDRK